MSFLIWLAILPSIIIGFIIYKADRVEKEPKRELLKAFLLGVVAVILTLIISSMANISSMNHDSNNLINVFIYSFLGISLIEETCKWICSCYLLKNNKNFNYLFDGIVYTTFVSLGFATIENILYTISGGVMTGIIRAITTVPAHAFFGITSGYLLSLAKQEKMLKNETKKHIYIFLSIFLPFLLHGFYDFCLLTKNYFFFMIYIVFVVSLYSFSIYHVKKMMKLDYLFIKKKRFYCKICGNRITNEYCENCQREKEED